MSVAAGDGEGETEADRQQDGVCAARLCARPRPGLREYPHRVSRGQTVQSLHVQLGAQIHVNRNTPSFERCRISTVHERSVGNCPQEVRTVSFTL